MTFLLTSFRGGSSRNSFATSKTRNWWCGHFQKFPYLILWVNVSLLPMATPAHLSRVPGSRPPAFPLGSWVIGSLGWGGSEKVSSPSLVNERSENSGLWESRGSQAERVHLCCWITATLGLCLLVRWLFVTLQTGAHQAPLSLQVRTLEWLPIPSPGNLSDPGIEPGSPSLQTDFFYYLSHQGSPAVKWTSLPNL